MSNTPIGISLSTGYGVITWNASSTIEPFEEVIDRIQCRPRTATEEKNGCPESSNDVVIFAQKIVAVRGALCDFPDQQRIVRPNPVRE